MIISLDTETSGVDLRHGALPFLVTICDEQGEQSWWEWNVDPLTRKPHIPRADLVEIQDAIDAADLIVCQNTKFDVSALAAAFRRLKLKFHWPWDKVRDTLMAGHLLASNQPHDLTAMALQYLGVNIEPYEEAVVKACHEARRMVQLARMRIKRAAAKAQKDMDFEQGEEDPIAKWRIAEKGLPEMPSAKDKVAKYDMWLPRAMAEHLGHPEDHPWWTVCSTYANSDSAVTLPIHIVQERMIRQRGLWEIYLERLKVLPVAYRMESRGVTINRQRLTELREEYRTESKAAELECESIAAEYGHDLKLPKSGRNKSLDTFIWDVLKLEKVRNPKSRTGGPSLDAKVAIPHYLATLEGKPLKFIKTLVGKRKRDTYTSYMDGYERYWLPSGIYNQNGEQLWYTLFPSLNPTGTDTLRWSSSSPNEQNIGKQGIDQECPQCKGDGCGHCDGEGTVSYNLRYCFGPAPGREWWSLDYDNLELRIPAYESGEQVMIEIFEKPNDPPYFGSYHLLNASILYPDLFWPLAEKEGEFKSKYKSTWYQWAKNFGFAVSYGAVESSGTADRAAHKPGAQRLVMDRLKEHTKLNQSMIDHANRYGYVETIPDKEVDPEHGYPLLCTRSQWGDILPTVPLNYHVQGTACWIMMRAMIKVDEYLRQINSEIADPAQHYHMIMNVHDEMVLDFPYVPNRGNMPKIRKVRKLMESVGDAVGVPLTVGVDYHRHNWSKGEAA